MQPQLIRAGTGNPCRWTPVTPQSRLARRMLRPVLMPLVGVLLGLLAVGVCQLEHILCGGNFHEVVSGQVYRSAQLSPEELTTHIQAHGIRTVINLRGENVAFDWYQHESATANRLGVTFENVQLWAYHPPVRKELLRLVELLDGAESPILVHCQSGADRAGLASVLALLLRTDCTLATARQQLALSYGHYSWGQAGCHDQMFDRYEEWLQNEQQAHTPERLRHWIRQVYDRKQVVR